MRRATVIRLVVLAAILVTLVVVGETVGVRRWLTLTKLRELTLHTGALGIVAFVAIFVGAELLHIPGLLFIAAGVAIWGPLEGGLISWVAGVLSVVASFLLVRSIGGPALAEARHPLIKRALRHLDDAPIRTVAVLRAVLLIAPTVTYALALTRVRFVPFLVGSAIGLVPSLAICALFAGRVLRWLGATG